MNFKNIKFIEFMLFGSGPKSFAIIGTEERENFYYSLFKKYNLYPNIIEYSINRNKNKGFIKIAILTIQLFRSFFNPICIGIFKKNFELIRCKQIYGSWSGLLLKIISQKKLIIRVGYSWSQSISYENGNKSLKYRISKIIERFLLENADGLIVGSKYLYNKFYKFNQKIIIVPNGINNKKFKINQKSNEYDYIFVGRLVYIKGIDRILDFVNRNKNKKFLIIGSNPLKIELKEYENVTYFPRIDNKRLPLYMNKSKNILNLSRSEGSPKGLIEGIACGCFPIVSGIEAHIDLLDDLKYGEIINYPNNDKDKIGNFSKKYLDEFYLKYSIENCVQIESEFMKKILSD